MGLGQLKLGVRYDFGQRQAVVSVEYATASGWCPCWDGMAHRVRCRGFLAMIRAWTMLALCLSTATRVPLTLMTARPMDRPALWSSTMVSPVLMFKLP